jgi:hypothetical protein
LTTPSIYNSANMLRFVVFCAAAAVTAAMDHMSQGDSIEAGAGLGGDKGVMHLEMQGDCNLVLYSGHGTAQRAVWSTAATTGCQGAPSATLLYNGEFVVKDSKTQMWTSGVTGDPSKPQAYYLIVQDDGNIVIRQVCIH